MLFLESCIKRTWCNARHSGRLYRSTSRNWSKTRWNPATFSSNPASVARFLVNWFWFYDIVHWHLTCKNKTSSGWLDFLEPPYHFPSLGSILLIKEPAMGVQGRERLAGKSRHVEPSLPIQQLIRSLRATMSVKHFHKMYHDVTDMPFWHSCCDPSETCPFWT